jgi:catechol 2,3-dioxygenase-like lactoylglutathione lyase family enzyme
MPTDDRITVQRIEHVAVVVSDVERAKAFYGGVLGLTEVPRPESFDFAGAWYRNGPTDLHLTATARPICTSSPTPSPTPVPAATSPSTSPT